MQNTINTLVLTPGPPGATGPGWISGAGAPAGGTGSVGDFYLNTSNEDYYKKTGSSTWTLQGSLAGATGSPGVAYTARGAYAGGTTYAQGDEVTSSSILYISLQSANTGHTPASSPTWWQSITASQTPWIADIAAAGHTLSGVGHIDVTVNDSATGEEANANQSGLAIKNSDTTNNNWAIIEFKANGGTVAGGIGFQFVNQGSAFGNINFFTRGAGGFAERMKIDSLGRILLANTPVFANNAAALTGGLTAGMQYRTSTGVRMEVF